MSRSPHRATFSRAGTAFPRIVRASPQMRSVSSGFRLWGMDDDPVCPAPNGSSTSWISVRCIPRISVANFSSDAATRAAVVMKWAWRSRCTTWFETGATSRPRWWHTRSSICGGIVAWVPTAPDILPTRTDSRAAVIRSRCRRSSSHHRANFSPKVIGSACTPWVRPTISVSLWQIACSLTASMALSISRSSRSAAATNCKAWPVSSMSEDVIPRWSQRPSGPRVSVIDLRNAVTSCRVVSKISIIR